jgi:hypothetical protein
LFLKGLFYQTPANTAATEPKKKNAPFSTLIQPLTFIVVVEAAVPVPVPVLVVPVLFPVAATLPLPVPVAVAELTSDPAPRLCVAAAALVLNGTGVITLE